MDTKPDKKCVDEIFKTAEPYYSGQWIRTASGLENKFCNERLVGFDRL